MTLEQAITARIREVYSEAFWHPIPEAQQAKDAVAADCLRTMAPALAAIAVEVFRKEQERRRGNAPEL
jgi:hypothetical protein